MNYRQYVLSVLNPNAQKEPKQLLINGVMGVAAEAGEALDVVKKHLFMDRELERDKLVKEIGDVLYYIEIVGAYLGMTTEEIQAVNMEKLQKRYAEGFSVQASIARVDTKPSTATFNGA